MTKSRGLSGVHLISECALDKHVWRTPDVDHLGNTSRLRFSNSYISTDKQPAVRRTVGCPEKKQEESFISVILIPKNENRLDFDFQGNSWQPDEQKCDQKKYDQATDVSFLLLRPTADHPESCHHQSPVLKDVAREDGHKPNPANNRLIVILSWTEKEKFPGGTAPKGIYRLIQNQVNQIPIPDGGIKIHVAGEGLIMKGFNLTAHPYFISLKSSRYSLVIAHVRVALLRKSNFIRRIREQPTFPTQRRRRRRRGYLGVAWQRHGGRATTKERSIDLSRRMAGLRICIYVCTSAALAVA
ncbi:hypothetical protein ALC56_12016 [Trachymyrmex septentrionalis]|uniref:Uncharacterized protein n=1 Tax=Trachymyrmex septentrionalis TaxID=34720 RepID=A0A195EZV7_9HYME|nr:hypothetical protein ALC56_12016 [Trachymyrmex septentrionalis]